MQRLSHFAVTGLFGDTKHSIDLRPTEPTILTGPNGVGKTQVLRLIHAILRLDANAIASVPFEEARLSLEAASMFDKPSDLVVVRSVVEDETTSLTLWLETGGRIAGEKLTVAEVGSHQDSVPEYMREMVDGRWYDTRTDQILSNALVERRYGVSPSRLTKEMLAGTGITEAVRGTDPIFIDTKRLDTPTSRVDGGPLRGSRSPVVAGRPGAKSAASRIDQYVEQLRVQVTEARRASLVATQTADLSFAVRALAAAHDRVNETDLRKRYSRIVEQYERLTRNGLATGEAPLQFPDDTTPTVRRILNVFLNDWEQRLRPLIPLNEKLTVLRRVLDEKFETTGKSTMVTSRGGIGFRDRRGQRIQVSTLSSGEQHLVALYSMLMFSARPNSIVLVDEPEISLHAVWKHAFLRDITEVAQLANLQILIATHSSAIINGRWDLTEDLKVSSNVTVGAMDGGTRQDDSDAAADDSEDWLA